jgi:hypothetical protein
MTGNFLPNVRGLTIYKNDEINYRDVSILMIDMNWR